MAIAAATTTSTSETATTTTTVLSDVRDGLACEKERDRKQSGGAVFAMFYSVNSPVPALSGVNIAASILRRAR